MARALYLDSGSTLLWYLLAGVEVPIGDAWSLVFEGRWRNADDELEGDLAGLGTLDLGGTEISAGFSYRF